MDGDVENSSDDSYVVSEDESDTSDNYSSDCDFVYEPIEENGWETISDPFTDDKDNNEFDFVNKFQNNDFDPMICNHNNITSKFSSLKCFIDDYII